MSDVHTDHCCIVHGCKYGDKDCTVTTASEAQAYKCERCHEAVSSWYAADMERSAMIRHGLWPSSHR